jgi:hypothetical protein
VHRVEREGQSGQRRAKTVVEVAADAPAFFLSQLNEASASSAQLVGQAHRVSSRRDLRRKVSDQAAVDLPQCLACPRCDVQLSYGGTLVNERIPQRPGPGLAIGGRDFVAPGEGERDVLKPQRLTDRRDGCAEYVIGAE